MSAASASVCFVFQRDVNALLLMESRVGPRGGIGCPGDGWWRLERRLELWGAAVGAVGAEDGAPGCVGEVLLPPALTWGWVLVLIPKGSQVDVRSSEIRGLCKYRAGMGAFEP